MINLGNVGDLSKPVTALIERISDAVGGVARPYQIVREAKAEAKAGMIRAESEIEIADAKLRALHRFAEEETRKQLNMESIIKKSISYLNEDSSPEKLEDDWIRNHFDKCRNISDDEIQELWGRILAGEANNPGSFSRKTVNLVADIDKRDAELFRNMCRFIWLSHADSDKHPFIFDLNDDIYTRFGIDYEGAYHLQSLGLVSLHFQSHRTIWAPRTGVHLLDLPKKTGFSYYGKYVELTLKNDSDNDLHMGNVTFTRAGAELANISESGPIDEFFDYVYDRWASESFVPPRKPG